MTRSARDHAVAAIQDLISHGRLLPGQKLNEQALSDQLEVSRNTLREAFAVLDGGGILTRIAHRGVFISRPDANDVADIYTTRSALEPAALLWAKDLDLSALTERVETAEQARQSGHWDTVGDANQDFHRIIVAAMGAPALDTTMSRLLARMRLIFVEVVAHVPDFHDPFVDQNRTIVQLLEQGHREDAATTLRGNLADTAQRLTRFLESDRDSFETGTH